MSARKLACIVLAAGKGTRMKSDLPKVLHRVAGRSMLRHVLAAAEALKPEKIVVVAGPGMEAVAKEAAPHAVVVQERQQGTGDAVMAARPALNGFDGDVLVLYGDTPLVTPDTLATMRAALAAPNAPAVVVLGVRPEGESHFGRLILNAAGALERIVEYLDATPAERAQNLCNAGLMAFDGASLFDLLAQVAPHNAKGEYYLTDMVAVARAAGRACAVVEGAMAETLGVNSRAELALAEKAMQARLRASAMAAGATLVDPDTVWLCADTVLGRDVTIGPNVVFGPGVTVEDGAEILPFCHLQGARVAAGATVGPFARLRPGAHVGEGAHVGNFVEMKNATLGSGAKANHLSYLGDADIGPRTNVGAGTITCNYDGFLKHRTEIGAGAFIGSNSALVAPVRIGDGAIVGAGSVIVADVPADAIAVARGDQKTREGTARKFREARAARKAAKAGA